MDWFLYDGNLHHERIKSRLKKQFTSKSGVQDKKNLFNYTDMIVHVFLIMLLLNIILSSTNISVRETVWFLIYSKKVSDFWPTLK